MLTPYLEQLIHEGKAEYRETAIGGSGVGTIPVQPNERVVITDFIWNPFTDVDFSDFGTLDYLPVVTIEVQIEAPGVISPGDFLELYDLLVLQGDMLVTEVVGNLVTGVVGSGDFFTGNNFIDVTSAAVGQVLNILPANIIVPGNELVDITSGAHGIVQSNTATGHIGYSPGTLVIRQLNGLFSDLDLLSTVNFFPEVVAVQTGAISIITDVLTVLALAVESCLHTIRFRSKQVEAVWNFRDIPFPTFFPSGGDFFFAGISFPDPLQVHCYIFCPETVQIDIFKFSPEGNVFTQGNPTAKSAEPIVPNGYRDAVANPPVLDIQTGQGATIRPLGGTREDFASTARTKFQFVDDIGDLTELSVPTSMVSFPLVNIGYVVLRQPASPII